MKCYRFDTLDGIGALKLHDEGMPSPQRGEVLVKVQAVSLNYRDIAVVNGRYVHAAEPGLVPASDAAGVIVDVGEGVVDFKPGDRVVSSFHPRWFGGPLPDNAALLTYGSGIDGWLAEYKVVSQEAVVAIPSTLDDVEASTLPCAATTAWTALAGPAPIRAGHSVLTLGTGGVSVFALQFAKLLGARVVATTSSEDKAAMLRQLGADAVVNYAADAQWGKTARQCLGGRGFDRVIEVGGAGTINQSLFAVAKGGEIALIGFLTEDNPGIDYYHLKSATAVLRGIAVGDRAALQEVVQAVAAGGLPVCIIAQPLRAASAKPITNALIKTRFLPIRSVLIRLAALGGQYLPHAHCSEAARRRGG